MWCRSCRVISRVAQPEGGTQQTPLKRILSDTRNRELVVRIDAVRTVGPERRPVPRLEHKDWGPRA